MSITPLLLQLNDWLTKHPWLFLALRQDTLVWEALQDTDLCSLASESLPEQPEHWSPAALALLALDYPLEVEELQVYPLQPLGFGGAGQFDPIYESWLQTRDRPTTLAQAGLLALAARERFRLVGGWKNMLVETGLKSGEARTILACLYGMLPEPGSLLMALMQPVDGHPRPDLVVHALFCNPMPDQAASQVLGVLLENLPTPLRLELLREVALKRPWLATDPASALLEQRAFVVETERCDGEESSAANIVSRFEWLIDVTHRARIYQLAGQPGEAIPLLAEALRVTHRLRGHLSAQLAQMIDLGFESGAKNWEAGAHETGLDAWKLAVQLAPDVSIYSAGLINELAAAGRLQEARSYLVNVLDEQARDPHPALSLSAALVASRLGEQEAAREAALKALELLEAGQALSLSACINLSGFFIEDGLFAEAQRAAQRGLERYPSSRDLFALSAQGNYNLGRFDRVAADAYAALAIEVASPDKYTASLAEAAFQERILFAKGEAPAQAKLALDRLGVRRLLVQSLESLGAWQAALHERKELIAELDLPTLEDQRALAGCAIQAGDPETAIEACRTILQSDPEDVPAHRILAEAAQLLGDHAAVIEHYSQVTLLAPEQVDAWLALARSQRLAGQQEQALETLRVASQAVPMEAEVHLALGEAYLERSAATQALACFRRSVELAYSPRAALLLGQTLYELGHIEEARQILEAAYQRGRSETGGANGSMGIELAYAYARTLLDLGESSQAVPLLKDVVLAQPDDPRRCLDLARGLAQMPDREDGARRSIPLLQRILDVVDADATISTQDKTELQADAWALLAEAHTTVGDLDLAMGAYRRAMELGQDHCADRRSWLALGLSRAALRLEQPETAVVALEDAANYEPYNADLQRALSDACLASDLAPEAYQAAKAALDLKPSDLETLVWFAEQGLRLIKRPGGSQLPVRNQVIEALQSASNLAPDRGDILLLLSELHLQNGDQAAMRETLSRLLKANDPKHLVSAGDLHLMARALQESGDTELAMSLLRRAIDQFNAEATDEQTTQLVLLADLHAEMALAYQQLGDSEATMHALEQALAADDSRADLHRRRGDMLYEMGRYDEALHSLEEAARLDEQDAELRYRMALILQLLGDLPQALRRAEQAIRMLNATGEDGLDQAVYMLAAELAYRMIQPHRALTYLQSSTFQSEKATRDFKYAGLQAELALDQGDEASAYQAVILMRELAPEHSRCLAARARLACLRGECSEGARLFREAIRSLQADGFDGAPGVDQSEGLLSLLAVSRAALESAQWGDAETLARRLIDRSPDEPLPYLGLAQVLVIRAEVQCLCQDLDVRGRSPGEVAMAPAARSDFEQAIQTSIRLVGEAASHEEQGSLDRASDEAEQRVALWEARGKVVFEPQADNIQAYQRALRDASHKADSLAALVMSLRRVGDYSAALLASQSDRHSEALNGRVNGHPLVLAQLALALAEIDLNQALEISNDGLDRAAILVSGGWPEIAMLRFLHARLAYRAGVWTEALDAVLAALSAWPDQARWHFLAAQIYLKPDSTAGLPDPLKAQEHLDRAIALEPENAPYHFELGRIYLQSGQARNAVQTLQRACELDPDNGDTWLALAQAQREIGELEQAASSAESCIERSSDSIQALLLRGEIALQTNNPRGALSRAQAVLRLCQDHAEALYLLARALGDLDRPAEALTALEKAIPHFEGGFPVQLERVHLVRRAQGLGPGLTALQKLAARFPKHPGLLALLSDWLDEAGDEESAVQAARLALQEDRDYLPDIQRSGLHYRIGLSTHQAGHLDQAVHHLSAAVDLDPVRLEPYLELGQVHQERREYQQALKVYRHAIQVAKGDYRPYYQAGLVLKDSKDYPAAEAMLRRASQLAPDDVRLHRLLAAVVALSFVHNRHMPSSSA